MRRGVSVRRSGETTVTAVRQALTEAGFRVEQSFDLRSALLHAPLCTCPHHGSAHCNCQYYVLQIFGAARLPVTLVVHGLDDQCWITLADPPNGHGPTDLAEEIMRTLPFDDLPARSRTEGLATSRPGSR